MRKLNNILLCVLTVCLVLGCLYLPETIFGAQDREREAEIVTYESEGVMLDFSEKGDMAEALGWHNQTYTAVFDIASGMKMTQDEAEQVFNDVIQLFIDQGLINKDVMWTEKTIEPALWITDASPASSLIMWKCSAFDEEDRHLTMNINDDLGKMVYLDYITYRESILPQDVALSTGAEQMALACSKHLDLQLNEVYLSDYYKSRIEQCFLASYSKPNAPNEEPIMVTLQITHNTMFFNHMAWTKENG